MDKCSGVALNPRSLQERKETQTKGNARKSPVALGGNWMGSWLAGPPRSLAGYVATPFRDHYKESMRE